MHWQKESKFLGNSLFQMIKYFPFMYNNILQAIDRLQFSDYTFPVSAVTLIPYSYFAFQIENLKQFIPIQREEEKPRVFTALHLYID